MITAGEYHRQMLPRTSPHVVVKTKVDFFSISVYAHTLKYSPDRPGPIPAHPLMGYMTLSSLLLTLVLHTFLICKTEIIIFFFYFFPFH